LFFAKITRAHRSLKKRARYLSRHTDHHTVQFPCNNWWWPRLALKATLGDLRSSLPRAVDDDY
jgi:hypothetical protein